MYSSRAMVGGGAVPTRGVRVLRGGLTLARDAAGTGKSFALREIVRLLRSRHSKEEVYVTASTGIAACNVGGTTIHSFAGIGLGRDSKDKLVAKVLRDRRASARWRAARALVVDGAPRAGARRFRPDANPLSCPHPTPAASQRSPCWTGTSSTKLTPWPSASATGRSPSAACS